jgi:hypothetical protein
MEIAEYIKAQMRSFVKKFPEAKASYEYDIASNQHIIEFVPQSVYDSQSFMNWMIEFYKEALELYPADEIGFISEDAVVPLERVDFSVSGARYALPHKPAHRRYAETTIHSRMVCEGDLPYETKE